MWVCGGINRCPFTAAGTYNFGDISFMVREATVAQDLFFGESSLKSFDSANTVIE